MGGNLKQVANLAGVSPATASRVLSGSSYPVTSALRARVEAAAVALDYVPNAQARSLITGERRSVGLLVGEVGDPYFSAMINGAHVAAAEEGGLVTIIATGRDVVRELESFRMLQSHSASAIVVAGSGIDTLAYQEGLSARIRSFAPPGRVVLVGRHRVDPDVRVVRLEHENLDGGRQIGRHLAELGHTRVGILTGAATLTSTSDRVRGITQGLGEEPLVAEVPATITGGSEGLRNLLKQDPRLTAVVGTADQMAIGALAHCRERDIDVPRSLSVVGFNDIWVANHVSPGLTTVRLALEEVGATAVRLAFADPPSTDGARRFPVELVVRGSTGPARST